MPVSSLGTTPKQFIRELYTTTVFSETPVFPLDTGGYSRVFGYIEYNKSQVGLVGFRVEFRAVADPGLGVFTTRTYVHCPTNSPGGNPGGPPAITFSLKVAGAALLIHAQRQSPINPFPVPFRMCVYSQPVSSSSVI